MSILMIASAIRAVDSTRMTAIDAQDMSILARYLDRDQTQDLAWGLPV